MGYTPLKEPRQYTKTVHENHNTHKKSRIFGVMSEEGWQPIVKKQVKHVAPSGPNGAPARRQHRPRPPGPHNSSSPGWKNREKREQVPRPEPAPRPPPVLPEKLTIDTRPPTFTADPSLPCTGWTQDPWTLPDTPKLDELSPVAAIVLSLPFDFNAAAVINGLRPAKPKPDQNQASNSQPRGRGRGRTGPRGTGPRAPRGGSRGRGRGVKPSTNQKPNPFE